METMKADPNSKQSKKRAAAVAHNEKMRQNALVGSDTPTSGQREELERLSMKLYRASSKWQALLRKGVAEPLTEEVTEYIPEEKDEAGNVTRKEETVKHLMPLKYMGAEKSTISVVKRFTVESLTLELQAREKQYDEFMALIKKQREEQEEKRKAALLAEQVQNAAGGTTL